MNVKFTITKPTFTHSLHTLSLYFSGHQKHLETGAQIGAWDPHTWAVAQTRCTADQNILLRRDS